MRSFPYEDPGASVAVCFGKPSVGHYHRLLSGLGAYAFGMDDGASVGAAGLSRVRGEGAVSGSQAAMVLCVLVGSGILFWVVLAYVHPGVALALLLLFLVAFVAVE